MAQGRTDLILSAYGRFFGLNISLLGRNEQIRVRVLDVEHKRAGGVNEDVDALKSFV